MFHFAIFTITLQNKPSQNSLAGNTNTIVYTSVDGLGSLEHFRPSWLVSSGICGQVEGATRGEARLAQAALHRRAAARISTTAPHSPQANGLAKTCSAQGSDRGRKSVEMRGSSSGPLGTHKPYGTSPAGLVKASHRAQPRVKQQGDLSSPRGAA